jgi:hypothetical protein
MKTQLINSLLLVFIFSTACQSKKESDLQTRNQEKTQIEVDSIPYVIAQNYFVKNNVDTIPNPKIDTEEVFNSYFGMATTMGKNGKPTKIDFDKEYVIAVALPKTDIATTILPVSLKKRSNNSLVFEYKIELNDKQSYTSHPLLLVVVDKKFDVNLSLKLQN